MGKSWINRAWFVVGALVVVAALACSSTPPPQPAPEPVDVAAISAAVETAVKDTVAEAMAGAPEPLTNEDVQKIVQEDVQQIVQNALSDLDATNGQASSPQSAEAIEAAMKDAVAEAMAAAPVPLTTEDVEKIVQSALAENQAAASHQPGSIEVTDIVGRTVTINYPADRVILGEGRQIYAVAAIQPEDPFKSVVGWRDDLKTADLDSYNKYLAKFPEMENIPIFGDPSGGGFSVEQAINLNPDVVIMNLSSQEAVQESGLIEKLEQAGIPLVFIDYRQQPLENAIPSTVLLGRVFGQEERAQEIVDYYLREMNKVYSRLAELEGPKTTAFIERAAGYSDGCCNTFGSANLGLLIERAGGDNIATEVIANFGTMNPEQVLVADPEVIILTGANWAIGSPDNTAVSLGYFTDPAKAQEQLARMASRPGWETLQAVKNKRFHAIWHQFYNSPYHFVAFQVFAKWLYPEEFADLDPEATLRDFHEKFLPIDYSGSFWLSLE